ncbi:CBO0543 family protein [Evansella sp. AB-rgal1]|uniref:CBO0543 family protein n=1 Tax=Evansella sp. AB-rgal1 TaxID=3242696 RepID=UPI00359E1610
MIRISNQSNIKKLLTLYGPIVLTVGVLFVFNPRKQLRKTHMVFFFNQTITWLFILFVVEKGIIKNPLRIFKHASKANFGLVFFVFPALNTLYTVRFPEHKNNLIKLLYSSSFVVGQGIVELLLERYTELFTYVKWRWYYSFILRIVISYLSRLYGKWFFNEEIERGEP